MPEAGYVFNFRRLFGQSGTIFNANTGSILNALQQLEGQFGKTLVLVKIVQFST
jgi:hypothetical protein